MIEDIRYCHLCGSPCKDKYCTNESCIECPHHESECDECECSI